MGHNPFDRIVNFVEKQRWKYKKKLSRSTTLERDLGITGDEADEFMLAFFKEFNIDYSSFDPSNYFGVEYFDFLGLSKLMLRLKGTKNGQKETKDLTLGDLERVVLAGKWIDLD
ncbi:MAG: hypothetical protein C5B52_05085 [Bacteroidetes bacterium]|nr:MAG: hypothetical protein C5B52_05085 [Bacteroidota bacterium]